MDDEPILTEAQVLAVAEIVRVAVKEATKETMAIFEKNLTVALNLHQAECPVSQSMLRLKFIFVGAAAVGGLGGLGGGILGKVISAALGWG